MYLAACKSVFLSIYGMSFLTCVYVCIYIYICAHKHLGPWATFCYWIFLHNPVIYLTTNNDYD